jgi:UDPglucose 6-dehydrogenase
MNLAVVGTGYVGLVTGTCFAEMGNQVICVDIDKNKVDQLKAGRIPIFEPHLDVLFERNIKAGRLQFTTVMEEAVIPARVIFLALPTPSDANGAADLTAVLQVAHQIGPLIRQYKIVVNKSTVPVGTADQVTEIIRQSGAEDFDVVSNPEFMREGFAVDDFMKPDRVVIGTDSMRARQIMADLYAPFLRQGNPLYYMDTRSAEMTKYAANAFLAMRISFMNEIANLCEKTGANVDMVRIGIGADERIGKRFLFPGIGYGGSCFPKDVRALVQLAAQHNYDFKILQAVMAVNEKQRLRLIEKIQHHFGHNLSGRHFALWGLAFKPDTDDIREAPALYLIDELLRLKASVTAYDPVAMNNVKALLDNTIGYADDPYSALKDADALIIATEWSVFRTPEFDTLKRLLKTPVIFDGRNLYDPLRMKEAGFIYFSIGR